MKISNKNIHYLVVATQTSLLAKLSYINDVETHTTEA